MWHVTCDMLLDGWRKPDFLHPNTFKYQKVLSPGDMATIRHVSRKLLLFDGKPGQKSCGEVGVGKATGPIDAVERVELFFL